MNLPPFTHAEALALWSRLVAGWADHLDETGARTLIEGVPNAADQGGSYEGVTRMLWGLGGWLSQPDRPVVVTWRGQSYDTLALTHRALVNGTDPASPGYWGTAPTRGEYDQRTVESGQVALSLWQTRDRLWATLAEREQANLLAWLERFGRPPSAWHSNWALFWALNHAGRRALGLPHDAAVIESALAYLDGVYCGEGWYDDGPRRGVDAFDDYNWWVFGTHVLALALLDGRQKADGRRQTAEGQQTVSPWSLAPDPSPLLERTRLVLRHYPYFFAADGGYTEYGRSLSYKFARLGVALWAYRLGLWPHPVGMLRRLVGRHLRWYVDRGAVRPDGTLRQSLTVEGSAAVREPYIATGSTYWAMLAFAGLWSLPDADPFWTTDEEPLPVEQGDFVRVFPQPGWVVAGTQATGTVQRFNAGSHKYPAKYSKLVYTTLAPFNVGTVDGQPAPDGALCLTDGVRLAHRDGCEAWAVGEPGWLRARYCLAVGDQAYTVDTTLVVRGEVHLRAHRLTRIPPAVSTTPQPAPVVQAVEGPAPLGYWTGETPTIVGSEAEGWEGAWVGERMVAIQRLRGYDGQRPAAAWGGRPDLNAVYGAYVLPLLHVGWVQPAHELVCLCYVGRPDPALNLRALVQDAMWLEDGTLRVRWADGTTVDAPPLT